MRNANGGQTLLGVCKEGAKTGIEPILAEEGYRTGDAFKLALHSRIDEKLSPPPLNDVKIELAAIDEKIVCRIEVEPSPAETILSGKTYLRRGGSTIPLEDVQLSAWRHQRK